jgi:hypothetical protein
MSRNTPSSRADRARALAGALAAALAAVLPPAASAGHLNVAAPPLPAAVAALAPDLRAQGGGEMKFFGLSIYNGWYWAGAHAWTTTGPHALDLHYQRSLEGASIAERSVTEIEGIGAGNAAQRQRWGEAMRRIFPNVRKGDRITGVNVPPGIARFYFNGQPIGEIDDAEFARAFFGIWLDPRTSRPEFRKQLLGMSE